VLPTHSKKYLIDPSPRHLLELEEVLGELHSIKEMDIGLVALIGKIPVLLPPELGTRLAGLIGKRIGILRCDGYRLRVLNDQI
jgi:hypothetical protein